jgi:glutamate--cysteine ligase
MQPFAFEDGMGYERYVDYALDVPMYFVIRDKTYIDLAGASFRDFLEGRLPQLPGEKPTLSDWTDHLTTLFPEVRLKRYLEMRGADSGPWRSLCALPAFWTGLLYDQQSLDAAYDLIKDWTAEERRQLRNDVPRLALKAPFRGGTARDLARRTLDLAAAGLKARARAGLASGDESVFLAPLSEIVERDRTGAEYLLEKFHREWGGDVRPVFTEGAY